MELEAGEGGEGGGGGAEGKGGGELKDEHGAEDNEQRNRREGQWRHLPVVFVL